MKTVILRNALSFTEKALNVMLGSFLCLMGIFLFTNIFLRYFFNSGLVWAEELARFMFVWITFIGAVGALRDKKHLGFTSLVKKMPHPIKKFFFLVNNLIVMYLLYLVFTGSIQMAKFGWTNIAPSTGIPLTFMWIAGTISSLAMFIIIIGNIYQGMFVPGAINELVGMVESEDEVHLEKMEGGDGSA